MVAIYVTCFTASLSVGFVLAGYNQSGIVIQMQTGWNPMWTTLITASSILGLMLGSLLCDKFLKYGRITTAYIANAIIIASCVPQMF